MTKHDNTVYLQHILDAIRQIEIYLHDANYETFCQNRMLQDAVIRRLEIVGEASRNLTEEFKAQHQTIPWSEIIGMRHKIAHDYFVVDLRIVWDTIEADLPPVKDWLLGILEEI
jgi:uncharacterized protein with HEPN domain